MTTTRAYDVYVFDAYGTLFDVHSAVARHRARIGPEADRVSQLWRMKQLEYSWTRSLMGHYRDFWTLTEDALDFALASVGVRLSFEDRRSLLASYRTLSAYPEVSAVLKALRERGARTAILSNGSPGMLAEAVESAGIAEALDMELSVDALQIYKTAPAAYRLVSQSFDVPPEAVSFQSSNRWDVAGAQAFGFRTVWVNRTGVPDEYADLPPDRTIVTLSSLLD